MPVVAGIHRWADPAAGWQDAPVSSTESAASHLGPLAGRTFAVAADAVMLTGAAGVVLLRESGGETP